MNDTVQIELRGEISCASNFQGNSVFISYCFLLPASWECRDENQLSGNTICSTITNHQIGNKNVDVAFFNQLFTLSLTAPKSPKESGSVRLITEVTSVDIWERFQCQGYGVSYVPLTPGRHCLKMNTWRPLPAPLTGHAARVAEMRKFFIGGSPQLRDMGCSLLDAKGNPVLSRAGLCSASSGEIHFNVNVALQSHEPLSAIPSYRPPEPSQILVTSVDDVIEAFHKVQARMASVRDAMRLNLET